MFRSLLHRLEEAVIGGLLVSLTLLVFIEVVLRFGFGTGVIWMEEVSLYLGGWLVLIGASYALRMNAHIAVDALVTLLPGTLRRVIGLLAVVCALGYCALLLIGSYDYLFLLKRLGIEMQNVSLPRWIGQSMLIIGFGLLFLRLAFVFVDVAKGRTVAFQQIDEAKEAVESLSIGEDNEQEERK